MYACEQGNLRRLVSCYAFLRREIWTERKNERVKHRRSEAKPDSYIGHDCLTAKFFHGQVVDVERAMMQKKKEKEKFIRQYPLCYYSRRGWGGGDGSVDVVLLVELWAPKLDTVSTHVLAK